MPTFKTLALKVIENKNGTFSTLHGRVDVVGEWRARPKGRRLFTDAKIRQIRKSYDRGESIRYLADKYECSNVLIYHIVNRSVYKDVI